MKLRDIGYASFTVTESRRPPPYGRKQFPGTVSGKHSHARPKWSKRARYRFQELRQTGLTSVFVSDSLTSCLSIRSYHSLLLILLPGSLTSYEVQREALGLLEAATSEAALLYLRMATRRHDA